MDINQTDQETLLAYFDFLAKTYEASTLWTTHSKLNISTFPNIVISISIFIKTKNEHARTLIVACAFLCSNI